MFTEPGTCGCSLLGLRVQGLILPTLVELPEVFFVSPFNDNEYACGGFDDNGDLRDPDATRPVTLAMFSRHSCASELSSFLAVTLFLHQRSHAFIVGCDCPSLVTGCSSGVLKLSLIPLKLQ